MGRFIGGYFRRVLAIGLEWERGLRRTRRKPVLGGSMAPSMAPTVLRTPPGLPSTVSCGRGRIKPKAGARAKAKAKAKPGIATSAFAFEFEFEFEFDLSSFRLPGGTSRRR